MADDGNYSGGINASYSIKEPGTPGTSKPKSIFIPRDYSQGLGVRFERAFPSQLYGLVTEEDWETTIDMINSIFGDAERVCFATVAETIFGCMTCYLLRCCMQSRYEKKLYELNVYMDERNSEVFGRVGYLLTDPMHRGLRVLELAPITSNALAAEYAA